MNDLSKVVDKLLAQGLLALRGTCVMPRLVNSDYSNLAAQQGASIDVPIGRKYGFDWAMDQQVPSFEASVMTEGALTVNGANEAGAQVVSLAFHRDAIAFSTRPLMDSANGLGNLTQSAVDPVSGLSLRLEVSREHKRTRFSYDILYGADVVRRELGCRIAG